jgi:hypothetical protein
MSLISYKYLDLKVIYVFMNIICIVLRIVKTLSMKNIAFYFTILLQLYIYFFLLNMVNDFIPSKLIVLYTWGYSIYLIFFVIL